MLINSDFYVIIQDMSYFLFFLMSLSIQMFIYNRFDKKFQIGYERLNDKAISKIKNLFKKYNLTPIYEKNFYHENIFF